MTGVSQSPSLSHVTSRTEGVTILLMLQACAMQADVMLHAHALTLLVCISLSMLTTHAACAMQTTVRHLAS